MQSSFALVLCALIVALGLTNAFIMPSAVPVSQRGVQARRLSLCKTYGMTKDEIMEMTKKIVAENLSVDVAAITGTSDFGEDLGADSLDRVELVMGLEEAFDVTISDDAAGGIATIDDAVNFIDAELNK